MRNARKFCSVFSSPRLRKPLRMKATPTIMLSVDAKLPPITIPTKSSSPTQIDSTLSAPLVLRPATWSPRVSKKPTLSIRPRMPNAISTRPIRPAPIR
ncbi:hypothetical protein SGLAM104S_10095 [Streptomyces glaucescens]